MYTPACLLSGLVFKDQFRYQRADRIHLPISGDRVGWGYCHGSCRSCWACTKGEELDCDKRQLYGLTNLDQGSFASHAIWDEDFLFSIPEVMTSAAAAPMMCAGAAVYSAIYRAGIRWSDRVGVYGLGGLGHMAVQFAAKMGCKVVVYSHSATKESEAYRLGATEFYDLSRAVGTDQPPQAIDCLLLTGAQQPDWSRMIPLIRRGGTISAMTVDPTELRLPYMDLVMNAVQIQGSLPAPPRLHREMLEFAAQHGIAPIIETFSFDEEGINVAMERLRDGKMRYRGVIERIAT